MSRYVLCVLGGMALLWCLQFVWCYIRERRADARWEREMERSINAQLHREPVSIKNNQRWSDPAVKGFDRTMTPSQQREYLRACVRAHEERKHES